ncbi:sulfite exporter TauE/SafE family protein [uncultured Methanomethylovorans sp.]|uniref:sulfite exporter TauE/SafE family protein n=1 Tax=uncultured Methanomethylovorans sp. TaxID=183759 RepID=UPI002AA65D85|nr:sulfite exporter TauE/SafE family protein [uncultured Methanomethylovorans sp.]
MYPLVFAILIFFLSVLFSMIGLGGAIVYVPLFYWLGIDLLSAIPMGLLLNTATSASAAITYLRKGLVELRVAIPFLIISMIAAPIGAYCTNIIPTNMLLGIFSIIMVLVGIQMLKPEKEILIGSHDHPFSLHLILASAFIVGFIGGLLGIGGGSLVMPLLLYFGYAVKKSAATSGIIVLFTSLAGLVAHLSLWQPDMQLVIYITIAAILGAQVGSYLMHTRMKPETLRKMVGLVLWVMALRMFANFI